MIIPSIDLQGGQTVQLIGGAEKALDAGDPRPIAARFGRVGEVAVIDLDAAMGKGDHAALIEEVCGLCDARVGGGIRSVEAAKRWLDAGAAQSGQRVQRDGAKGRAHVGSTGGGLAWPGRRLSVRARRSSTASTSPRLTPARARATAEK